MIGSIVKWAVAGLGRADLRLRTSVHARGRNHRNNADLVVGLFIATIALATAGLKPLVVIAAVALFGLGWVAASTPNQPKWLTLTVVCLLPAVILLPTLVATPVLWLFIFLAARRRNQLRNTGEVAALVR